MKVPLVLAAVLAILAAHLKPLPPPPSEIGRQVISVSRDPGDAKLTNVQVAGLGGSPGEMKAAGPGDVVLV